MSNEPISLLAPAKLNLFLHITGRRADGYHELQTLFQLLDYGDQMQFEKAEPGVISLHLDKAESASPATGIESLPMDNNLIMQAAKRLREVAGSVAVGAKISLQKRIPIGAGLGGGSANAAITLVALNRLWGLKLDKDQLSAIGLELGADVPLFIAGRSAWAEGIGERLRPVELGDTWYLVACPNCSVATAEIFCDEHLTRNSQAIKMHDFLAGRARNDCESVTRKRYPQVDQAIKCLSKFAETRMTGTGSSIFARFKDEASARNVLAKLPEELPGFVAKGIDSLPHG